MPCEDVPCANSTLIALVPLLPGDAYQDIARLVMYFEYTSDPSDRLADMREYVSFTTMVDPEHIYYSKEPADDDGGVIEDYWQIHVPRSSNQMIPPFYGIEERQPTFSQGFDLLHQDDKRTYLETLPTGTPPEPLMGDTDMWPFQTGAAPYETLGTGHGMRFQSANATDEHYVYIRSGLHPSFDSVQRSRWGVRRAPRATTRTRPRRAPSNADTGPRASSIPRASS